jgi:hypothetical protein
MPKLYKILALTYAGLILTSAIAQYWINYSKSDGFVLPNHELVGGDFLCFYVAGRSARLNVEDLYDYETAYRIQQKIVAGTNVRTGYLPFAYPPLVALLFAPLSSLSLQSAYLVWMAFSSLLCGAAVLLILHHMPIPKGTKILFFIMAFSFVPFLINCLGGGQTACIGLLAVALVFSLLKSNRDLAAGITLSISYYKPPLFLLLVLFMILHKRWKMLGAFCIAALLLIAGSIAMVGTDGFTGYLQTVSHYTYGQEIFRGVSLPPNKGAGLYALLTMGMKSHPQAAKVIFAIIAIFLLAAAYSIYIRGRQDVRKSAFFDLSFALEVVASVLMSLQVLYYDLTILLAPMLIYAIHLSVKSYQKARILLWIPVLGLYTEFMYREKFAATTIKASMIFMCALLLSLFFLISRQRSPGDELCQ